MAAVRSWLTSLPNQIAFASSGVNNRSPVVTSSLIKASSEDGSLTEKDCLRRRQILVGLGALTTTLSRGKFALAEEVPEKFRSFVDFEDGYTYFYPADWREFDFLGHDSAFKDRFAALQHVRVGFIPTDKKDVHDLGSMDEVVFNLVKNIYAAPNQIPTVYDMQERTEDGKNYWTFEYELASPSFSRTAFATIAIGNGRYYTLVVGANERRWSRLRNRLKVVADSFKILDI
ncbi:photosynthetic NDH subunit of lumenal location 1, chloroplastic [Canna indica]|uniref:Photosynthetic NDH subunit of lumenal location 1, chloroplastic n=1 Tax=Canna indica TaxID=4628 RepID=A0AAQ3KE58_9LILI|nr:photosynthetic NDH subunit of lumenal location 1, chloroplastic [Canna indica]